jgi:magnesium chelatase family protein
VTSRRSATGRFARRTTPSRTPGWWAAGSDRGPVRPAPAVGQVSAWHTAGCCSWLNRSSADEMPEFGQHGLEVLRQPLEDKIVTISRAQGSLTFPANFMLVGAQNPCPCGYWGDPEHACSCSPMVISRYQKRLSGPLLDRIDIHVEVPRVPFQKLSDERRGEPSAAIRARVEAARALQTRRFANVKDGQGASLTTNADMGPTQVRDHCPVDETGRQLLGAAMRQMNLSARAYHRVLKLARTIADLAGSESIQTSHLAEALQYRPRLLSMG